jgi:hypothetical protein
MLAAGVLPGLAAAQPVAGLDVAGAIAPPTRRRLSLPELEALGLVDVVTTTPWTNGTQHFSGVPLQALLASLGAHGETLTAVALNDYQVTIPRAPAIAADATIATRQAGQPLSVRERGPFWIVFPWSRRTELDSAVVRQWAIWQLARIDVS